MLQAAARPTTATPRRQRVRTRAARLNQTYSPLSKEPSESVEEKDQTDLNPLLSGWRCSHTLRLAPSPEQGVNQQDPQRPAMTLRDHHTQHAARERADTLKIRAAVNARPSCPRAPSLKTALNGCRLPVTVGRLVPPVFPHRERGRDKPCPYCHSCESLQSQTATPLDTDISVMTNPSEVEVSHAAVNRL